MEKIIKQDYAAIERRVCAFVKGRSGERPWDPKTWRHPMGLLRIEDRPRVPNPIRVNDAAFLRWSRLFKPTPKQVEVMRKQLKTHSAKLEQHWAVRLDTHG